MRARFVEAGADGGSISLVFLEDLSRLQEQAQQLKLAALGRLTANIAHEIRNPLSAISHASELLLEEQRGASQERLLHIIQDNSKRLDRMVRDVLELTRRDRVHPETIRLAAFLPSFIDEFAQNERIPAARLRAAGARGERDRVRPGAPAAGAVEPAAQCLAPFAPARGERARRG